MVLVRTIAFVVLFLWLMLDNVAVGRNQTNKAENRDRFSLIILYAGNTAAIIFASALALGSFGSVGSVAIQIVGLAVLCVGIIVRSTAIAQLGRFHTPNVAVRADHQLLEAGLYKHVRHPSYLGALIAFFGFSLAIGNWLSLLVMIVVGTCIYIYRISEEETALAAAFGEPYRAYCRRTKRLIPGLY